MQSMMKNDMNLEYIDVKMKTRKLNVELKIVKKPVQDNETKFEDLEHVENIKEKGKTGKFIPYWSVRSDIYREGDGGLDLWIKEIKRIKKIKGVKSIIIYLYKIESWKDKIVNGINENDWFDDMLYRVRWGISYEYTNFRKKNMDITTIKYEYIIEIIKYYLDKLLSKDIKDLEQLIRIVKVEALFIQDLSYKFDEEIWTPNDPDLYNNLIKSSIQYGTSPTLHFNSKITPASLWVLFA